MSLYSHEEECTKYLDLMKIRNDKPNDIIFIHNIKLKMYVLIS